MITDSLYDNENNVFRKIALLTTIPCAILPMLIAAFGFMQEEGSVLLFPYEKLLFSAIYVLYAAGLYYSWKSHRHWVPAVLFLIHISSLYLLKQNPAYEWLSYITLISLVVTSISNQYFRIGTIACDDRCNYENL